MSTSVQEGSWLEMHTISFSRTLGIAQQQSAIHLAQGPGSMPSTEDNKEIEKGGEKHEMCK